MVLLPRLNYQILDKKKYKKFFLLSTTIEYKSLLYNLVQ